MPLPEPVIETSLSLTPASGTLARRAFNPSVPALDGAEIQACLARMLDSELFRKARRLRRLLQFLVDKRLKGSVHEATEYGIGIAVFDRDPATYHTGDDPIVRVQVGRLRTKLKLYYATPAHPDSVVISIPTGSYLPVIQRIDASRERCPARHLLVFRQLASAGGDAASAAFAQGMSEELRHQLFRAFGDRVIARAPRQESGEQAASARYVLEGSVRIDGALTRTAMRLIDAGTGAIVWSEQRDQYGSQGIMLQEELAQAICTALLAQLPPGSLKPDDSAG